MSMTLAEAIEQRDTYTGEHVIRVLGYTMTAGKAIGLSRPDMDVLRLCAILHDVGKIGVPDSILSKPSTLTTKERAQMQAHPAIGAEIISHIGKHLSAVIPAVRHHHERIDGTGYPDRLSGAHIPQFAKIIAIADAFDAMTSTRPYREAVPDETALAEIERNMDKQFDRDIAQAFLDACEQEGSFGAGRAEARAEKIRALQREIREGPLDASFWLSQI